MTGKQKVIIVIAVAVAAVILGGGGDTVIGLAEVLRDGMRPLPVEYTPAR